jgi:hypothetical protein
MAASEPLTTAQAVTKAIGLAQEAVKADEAGNIEEAIALYVQSVELIKMGLQIQPEAEVVDNSVLHKYSKLYSDRIDELRKSLAEDGLADLSEVGPADAGPQPFFMYDDVEVRTATPPEAAPSGPDEWRRPFWLMRILRTSMQFGGYLSPDARVFVPRRLWVQKGARFIGLAAKAECAQCLIGELQRVRSVDFRNPPALARELDRLCDTVRRRRAPPAAGGTCACVRSRASLRGVPVRAHSSPLFGPRLFPLALLASSDRRRATRMRARAVCSSTRCRTRCTACCRL